MYRCFFLTLLVLCFASIGHSQVIYVDFDSSEAAPGGGVTWNTATNSTGVPNLVDSTGNSTGIGLSITSIFNAAYTNGLAGTGPAAWTDNAALDGVAVLDFSGFDSAEIQLNGLSNATPYTIEIYGSRAGDDLDIDITIDGAFSDGNASDDYSGFNNTTEVLTWTNASTGVDGAMDVVFNMSNTGVTFGAPATINAMRITAGTAAIPEPSSFLLMALVAVAGSGRCWWQRKKKSSTEL